ncbi:MAG: NYN domain-containing protein [Candidatus Margulisbacteria bacterium]|nr:NYN domain-containing protein [Candidatus Margulisiibacteriota bacterium]
MKYIIDGYNVIGKLNHIDLSDPEKETKFLNYLLHAKRPKDMMTIVFDGHRDYSVYGDRHTSGQLTAIFTPPDQTADDYIKSYCSDLKQKTGILVISSDRDILLHSKHLHINNVTSEAFIKSLVIPKETLEMKPPPTHTDTSYWLNRFRDS